MFERARKHGVPRHSARCTLASIWLAAGIWFSASPTAFAQGPLAGPPAHPAEKLLQPPRLIEAERFLALRGWGPGHRIAPRASAFKSRAPIGHPIAPAQSSSGASTAPAAATWQPLGPTAVETPDFGLVTGRISAVALDPSDATGNSLYVGATGGGIWSASNAGTSTVSSIVFSPLTDNVTALGGAAGASISIGALTVQPGETGVILAGTGDPNDALDSYYGAGILRSTDRGNTWALIATTADAESGITNIDASFIGEGFAGFAWSTTNPQVVVAAVAQAFEGTVVDADLSDYSFEGLYYSSDSGATWHLATIIDGTGELVQGPAGQISTAGGNAATAVVWNPVRQVFVAAVRYHGYYQSADGITWTRIASQPGSGLTAEMCPTNMGMIGSIACPIFRGALAVNPQSGDTFAWTVDLNDQDQGLWQDQCQIDVGVCVNSSLTFAQQWNTAALETSTLQGPVTIADGVYNLALAAVPSQQDTLLIAGANDLWRCSLAMGCVWRNTTNSTTCMSAQVGEFQHAIAWDAANPLEIFLGNDSGLWRSMDAIGETGPACSAADSTHFQNLNGSLGSLAEPQSLSPVFNTPYTLMAGLGVNGAAGVKSSTATTDWPQILSGYGGPVSIDPTDQNSWYVNDEAGVAIYACSQLTACTPSDFGLSPVVTDGDVGGDGDSMSTPAPFLVDPADSSQLLIGTCRVWRGPADGSNWSASNAISPILDSDATGVPCNGDALVRSIAAMGLANGSEVIYLGTYGSAYNGADMPGHVLTAVFNPSADESPQWTDLTLNPVANNTQAFNQYGFGISSITIDPLDATGNTVYVTIEGMPTEDEAVHLVYGSTNGGATWTDLTANLPAAPANSLEVDPQNANTVYLATDVGVYYTTEVASCGQSLSNCWSVFGSGLPAAPAVALSTSPVQASPGVLVAATYGRGIWQTPLWSSATAITAASAAPANVAFTPTALGVASQAVQVELIDTGSLPLTVTSIVMAGADPGDFSETDNCQTPPAQAPVAVGGECTFNVIFTAQVANIERTAAMTIFANVYGGQLTIDLTGTGSGALGAITLSPNPLNLNPVEVGTASAPLPIAVTNNTAAAVPVGNIAITAPFSIVSNSCGTSLSANSLCQIEVEFAPTQSGAVTGLLTLADAEGSQTVELTGTGEGPPTDVLNPTSLTFPATPIGQSTSLPVTITNTGALPLTELSVAISSAPSGQFQVSDPCGSQVPAQEPGICTVTVQFTPTQLGAITGTLTVTDFTTQLDTQTVSLSGAGVSAPAFSVIPASLTFSNQQPGVASAPQSITITNTGGAAMANIGFAIVGAAAANYSIVSTTCGALLGDGASCIAQIVFTPNATGAIAAAVIISSSSDVTPVSIPLNGSGQLANGLITSPKQINFSVLGAGQSSPAQTVTVTNSSAYTIASVTLAARAPFSIAENNCSSSLGAAASCTAAIVFQPTSAGPSSGSLTATSPAVAMPAAVALSGIGFDFALNVSGPTLQTVASGQQANYTLVVIPNGANGSFNFACGTLPKNALCLFSPATESINDGVQGNLEVEISTGGSLSSRLNHFNSWRPVPLVCGLLLLPLAVRRRSKIAWLIVLAVIVATGVTSCTSSGGGSGEGGGSGGTGSSGGSSTTPPGNYTIPVTVTSTGVSHSVNLSLTVD